MIAENLGRLFEVGFNIGILAFIEHHQIKHNFGNLYRHDLQHLHFPAMLKRMVEDEELISTENIGIVEKWSLYTIQKGFLSGLNFFGEYIKAAGWDDRHLPNTEILYYQCSFCGENSIKTYSKNPDDKEYAEFLSQFGTLDNLDTVIRRHKNKGEFLKADTLMLLKNRDKYRILSLDLSVFSVKSAQDLLDLEDRELENQRRMLLREISYLRSKSFFSKLRIDTGSTGNLGVEFSEDLKLYFTAFKREDKESAKLIQAASYAHSFYGFLLQTCILTESAPVVFNAVGYSDRGISAMSLRPENLNVLATCAKIYKNEAKKPEINIARREVLGIIQRNANRSFTDGKLFVEALSEKPLSLREDGIAEITHTERMDGFLNSIDTISADLASQLDISPKSHLRDAHAELIRKALVSDDTYIFLTGNPGIGKTTAIANFLQAHLDEGFLFFYVSPRKQVNLDIIEKFKSPDTEQLSDSRLFCINTNASIIKENGGKPTVEYHSNQRQDDFTAKSIHFLNATRERQRREQQPQRLKQETEDTFRDIGERTAGVLSSICEGIHALIDSKSCNNIVATASIQSLRITPNGANTLEHLDKIFKGAYNKREGKVIPSAMRQISQRIKHVFIMVDEITGDDSGVNFLKGISQFLSRFQLAKHGFNTKVIVADASIVDPEVITQHLSEASPEPDKIYFRMAKQTAAPISVSRFPFKRAGAIAINANSYPARSLSITYKVFVECLKYSEEAFSYKGNSLVKAVQSKIAEDISAYLEHPDADQLLVYIQDKKRLQELIEKLRSRREKFKENEDYLEIHANLSEEAKKNIHRHKNNVKVIFMTSSASRGLSFPKAKRILAEIPRFQVERNLMEVIQVIYRARGEYWENGESKTLDGEDKELIFYLSDRALYYPKERDMSFEDYAKERQLSIQESVLSLLNILLILKISVMTRIVGAWRLGRKEFMMIPIGGKSVSAAGDTFTSQMTNLIRELKNEHRRRPSNLTLQQVYTSLQEILSRAEFTLLDADKPRKPVSPRNRLSEQLSYLSLRDLFNRQFSQLCGSFDKLLDYGKIEPGHISGSLLVVPVGEKTLEETYQIRLEQQIRKHATPELIAKMRAISHSLEYPENLRTALRGGAMELVKLLSGEVTRTQWFEQSSQRDDQYYALPLFAFIAGEAMRDYFKTNPEEEEDTEFRTLMSRYVHSLYPAYNTLPIGRKYGEFPFLIFRSYSLEEMREKIFTDKYLLTSSELNVLNLILSKEK
ncbi:helicase-related protein [Kamptonema formosum]|uniref:helicase-related protein n=1 Tax=Kamptonema formosum TaxID=331992 RepID=UPI00034B3594|nr:helicase-related protein [Oscillatoria sp. PCC 10802]